MIFRLLSLLIIIFDIAAICYSTSWDIEIRIINDHVIPAEQIYVEVKITNSSVPLPRLEFDHHSIDGEACAPCISGTGVVDKDPNAKPSNIVPQPKLMPVGYTEVKIFPINSCACVMQWDKFSYGEHTFCYHWKNDIKACAKFYFEKPTGVEAEAYKIILDNAYEEYEDELNRRIKHLRFYVILDCKFPDILRNYPSSIYTAWIYYSKIFDPTNMKIERIIDELKRNVYTDIDLHAPEPDPDKWDIYNGRIMKGRRTISSAPEVALWLIEKSELILRYHPDFPFANKLKVQIALCNISLGLSL